MNSIRVFCIANHPLNPHEFVSSGWDNTLQVQVKLGFKELLNKEHIGNSEPFPMTYLPVYFINIEQPDVSEQFFFDPKVPSPNSTVIP